MASKIEIMIVGEDHVSPEINKVEINFAKLEERVKSVAAEMRSGLGSALSTMRSGLENATTHNIRFLSGLDKMRSGLAALKIDAQELGDKLGQVGQGFSMLFTAPLVAGIALLTKAGTDAKAAYAELGSKAAPEIRIAALAWQEMEAAISPARSELAMAAAEILQGLVPVLKELAPTLTEVAHGVSELGKQFAALPTDQKKTIIGFVGVLAAIGPVLMAVGQGLVFFASLQSSLAILAPALGGAATALQGFGQAAWAALGPVGALIAASMFLIGLWNSDFSQPAKQAFALTYGQWAGMFGGDSGQATLDASRALGVKGFEQTATMTTPGSNQSTQLVYAPAISLATESEAQRTLNPFMDQWARQKGLVR